MFLLQRDWIQFHESQFLVFRLVFAPILTGLFCCFLTILFSRCSPVFSNIESSSFVDPLFSSNAAASRRESFYVAIFLVFLILLIFNNVFFFGHSFRTSSMCPGTMPSGPYNYTAWQSVRPVLDTGASSWAYEPWAAKVRNSFANLRMPLWNPNSGVGVPLLANMQSAPFSPFRLLVHLLPFQYAWELYFALRILAAGFFTFAYLRLFDRSILASFTSSIIFMFCGYNILYVNMGHLDVDVLVPAAIFASEWIFRNPRPIRIAFGSLIVCFAILGGMPESAFCVFLLVALYYAFRVLFFRSSSPGFKQYYLKKVIPIFAAFLLGLLLSGPQLFPFLEYLHNSWTGHVSTIGTASNPLIGGISLIIPYFFGKIFNNWNDISSFSLGTYIGSIPLFLTLLSIFSRKNENDKKLVYFYAIFCLFFISKYFGLFFINWIGYLPVFNKVIFVKFCLPEFSFCIAVLAGMGSDALIQHRVSPRSLVLSLFSLLCIFSIYLLIKPLELFPQLEKARTLRYVVFTVLVTLLFLCLAFIFARLAVGKNTKLSIILLVVVAATELVYYIPFERAVRYDAATVPPYINYLRSDPDTYRVLGTNSILYPNTSSYYNVDSITNLDAMYPSRYLQFIRSFISPESHDRFVGDEVLPPLDDMAPYLNLLNVKYILVPSKSATASKLQGNNMGDSLPPYFSVVYNHEIRILKNNNYFPRAYMVSQAVCAKNGDESLSLINTLHSDLKQNVILEDTSEFCAQPSSELQTFQQSEAKILNYGSNEIIIHTKSSSNGFLVLTDLYYPGWKAYVDGQEKTILKANYLFRALPLKAGSHQVRFVYAPASFNLGLLSCIASSVGLGLFVILKRKGLS
jgi:hypothetical protein